jgi:hypothetical protein
MKLNNSPKISNSITIIEGGYKPSTYLKFSKKNKELYVSIFKKQTVYKNRSRKRKSKYLGIFKAENLL